MRCGHYASAPPDDALEKLGLDKALRVARAEDDAVCAPVKLEAGAHGRGQVELNDRVGALPHAADDGAALGQAGREVHVLAAHPAWEGWGWGGVGFGGRSSVCGEVREGRRGRCVWRLNANKFPERVCVEWAHTLREETFCETFR